MRGAVRENLQPVQTGPFASEIQGEVPLSDQRFSALTAKSTDDEIGAPRRAFTATVGHSIGNWALGTVLDDEFRVKGVQGLSVRDASMFPGPIAAMPSCTVYAGGRSTLTWDTGYQPAAANDLI